MRFFFIDTNNLIFEYEHYVSIHFSYFSDLNKFQEGIGEKIGMCVFFMTIFSANIINAFYHGWQLTLVMMAPMPVSSILHISMI